MREEMIITLLGRGWGVGNVNIECNNSKLVCHFPREMIALRVILMVN